MARAGGMEFIIRPARVEDFARLKAIEIDAFETLRQSGAVTGEAESSSDAELLHLHQAGVLLTAVDGSDLSIGYVGATICDDRLHISEIDVARSWQRMGVGRALMLAVLAEARARSVGGATLTTDRLAPFNAAFYTSLGFRLLAEDELTDRLRQILLNEHEAGFDPARRVAMELILSAA